MTSRPARARRRRPRRAVAQRPRRRPRHRRLLTGLATADPRLFGWVARQHAPVLDALLPRLSVAADHAKLWVGVAALLWARGGRSDRRAAVRGVLALAATSVTVNLPVKLAAARARPDATIVPEGRRLPRLPSSPSFPSGHTASAAAFATAVGFELPRARWPLAAAAAAVGLSRVYTGAHYPADVAAGAVVGVGIAFSTLASWPLAARAPARGAIASAQRPGADGDGLAVVVNTEAGGAFSTTVDRLRHELPAARVRELTAPEDLTHALHEAGTDATALGVAGGDGTVRTAAEVAYATGLPLLVVPTGSLNHLATDVGIATLDDAVDAVRQGLVVDLDLAEIDGLAFVNAAALGVYPHLVDMRRRLEPRLGKWPALLLGLARVLPEARPTELDLDGRPLRVWQLFFGNCRHPVPGVSPTNRRRLDDGLLDVRLLHAGRLARVRFLGALLLGRLGRSAVYEQRTAREVRVAPREPTRLAADGETFAASPSFVVRKRPRPVRLLVPPTARAAARR